MKVSNCILIVVVGVGLSVLLPIGAGVGADVVPPPAGQADGGDDVSAGKPKHCNSDELQGVNCEAPGNCWNACSFWCGNADECKKCCNAFKPKWKLTCLRWCKETWELEGIPE